MLNEPTEIDNRPVVLLTHGPTALANYFGERAMARLSAAARVRHHADDAPWTEAELADAARGCTVVIADRSTPVPATLLARLPDAVAVSRSAVDIRNVDVAAASGEGILVTRCSAGFMAAVSEWIIGAMIALARDLPAHDAAFHRGVQPVPGPGRELRGATLGIVGYGAIGRYLAPLGLAFGMRVLVHDPHVEVDRDDLESVSFERLLAESDHVVSLAVAIPATFDLFDAAAFAAMRPGAFFINASRGELVDDAALLAALDSGRLAGCALDVGRAPDQMPSPALAAHPKVLASPHIGGLTPQAVEHQALEVVDQAIEILAGRLPAGAVNATLARRFGRPGGRTAG